MADVQESQAILQRAMSLRQQSEELEKQLQFVSEQIAELQQFRDNLDILKVRDYAPYAGYRQVDYNTSNPYTIIRYNTKKIQDTSCVYSQESKPQANSISGTISGR